MLKDKIEKKNQLDDPPNDEIRKTNQLKKDIKNWVNPPNPQLES